MHLAAVFTQYLHIHCFVMHFFERTLFIISKFHLTKKSNRTQNKVY